MNSPNLKQISDTTLAYYSLWIGQENIFLKIKKVLNFYIRKNAIKLSRATAFRSTYIFSKARSARLYHTEAMQSNI